MVNLVWVNERLKKQTFIIFYNSFTIDGYFSVSISTLRTRYEIFFFTNFLQTFPQSKQMRADTSNSEAKALKIKTK